LLEESDIKQIDTFLDCLAQADPSFQCRRVVNRNGHETGYIWQTGVMRRDFQLNGSTLFVDRLGRSLNNKDWVLMTLAMLSRDRKVCVGSEAIVFKERIDAYAWMIRQTV
jgi:hypothetical protein